MTVPPDDNTLQALEYAVADLVTDTGLTLDHQALSDRSCRLQKLTNQLDAIRTTTLRQTEQALIASTSGDRAGTLIAGITHVPAARVREDQRYGRWLADFPVLTEAHLAGTLSQAHIKLLRSVDNLRNHHQLQEDQSNFVQFAVDLDFKDFENVVRYWLNASDPAVRFAH